MVHGFCLQRALPSQSSLYKHWLVNEITIYTCWLLRTIFRYGHMYMDFKQALTWLISCNTKRSHLSLSLSLSLIQMKKNNCNVYESGGHIGFIILTSTDVTSSNNCKKIPIYYYPHNLIVILQWRSHII